MSFHQLLRVISMGEGGIGSGSKAGFLVFSLSFEDSNQLKTLRKRAFQKEQILSFHNHKKILKSVHKRKSYKGKCV